MMSVQCAPAGFIKYVVSRWAISMQFLVNNFSLISELSYHLLYNLLHTCLPTNKRNYKTLVIACARVGYAVWGWMASSAGMTLEGDDRADVTTLPAVPHPLGFLLPCGVACTREYLVYRLLGEFFVGWCCNSGQVIRCVFFCCRYVAKSFADEAWYLK